MRSLSYTYYNRYELNKFNKVLKSIWGMKSQRFISNFVDFHMLTKEKSVIVHNLSVAKRCITMISSDVVIHSFFSLSAPFNGAIFCTTKSPGYRMSLPIDTLLPSLARSAALLANASLEIRNTINVRIDCLIHLARQTVPPVVRSLFSLETCFVLTDFEKWGRMDGQKYVRTLYVNIVTQNLFIRTLKQHIKSVVN